MSTQVINRSEDRPEAVPALAAALKAADEAALYRPKIRMPQVSAFELETIGPLPQCLTRNGADAPDIFETSSAEMARVLASMPLEQLFGGEPPANEQPAMAQTPGNSAAAAPRAAATGLRPEISAPRQRTAAANTQDMPVFDGMRQTAKSSDVFKKRALAGTAFVVAACAAMATGLYAARHFHDAGPGVAMAAIDPGLTQRFGGGENAQDAGMPAAAPEIEAPQKPAPVPQAEAAAPAAQTAPSAETAEQPAKTAPAAGAEPQAAASAAVPAIADMDTLTNDVVRVLSKMGDENSAGASAASDPEELRAALKNLVGQSAKIGQSTDDVIRRLDAMLAGQPAAALPDALTNGDGAVDTAMLVRSVSGLPATAGNNYLSMIEQEGGATRVQGGGVKAADGFLVEGGARYLIVQKGESLSHIAFRAYGDPMLYPKIMRANRSVLRQGDLLTIGMKLKVPS